MAVNGNSQTFLTNGLVAYYPFNGNANDASGDGYDASVQGNYYYTNGTLHLIGDGQLFYNGGGYVALPDYGNLNSGFTVSIWVGGETDQGNSIYAEYYVWFDNNNPQNVAIGQHDVYAQDGLTSADFPLTITNYTPWKQLVLTYSPGHVAAFLNGVMVGSTNVTVNPFPTANRAIGKHWWNGGSDSSARMTMNVKNFRIYNRALSASEVQQLYAIESGVPFVGLIKAVKPSFSNLTIGTNYQMQISTDLVNWTNSGSAFTATNNSMVSTQYFDVPNWNQLFFRLQ